jgi:O-antigen/teichoic acid export membrane protein
MGRARNIEKERDFAPLPLLCNQIYPAEWSALLAPDNHEKTASVSVLKRIILGFFHATVGAINLRLAAFLAFAIVARLLGAKEMGVYSVIWTTVASLMVFSAFGVHVTTTRMVAACRVADKKRIGILLPNSFAFVLATASFLSVVIGGLVAPRMEASLAYPNLAALTRLAIPNIALLALILVGNAALQGLEAFSAYSRVTFISGMLFVTCTYTFTVAGGLKGAVLGMVVSNALSFSVVLLALRHSLRRLNVRLQWRLSGQVLREIFSFSVPLFLAGVLVLPAWWFSSVYVARFYGFAEVGLLNAAFSFFLMVTFLPSALNVAVLPLLADKFVGGESERFSSLTLDSFRITCLLSACVTATLYLFATPICVLAYGPAFASAGAILKIMCGAGFFSALASVFAPALVSAGKVWTAFVVNFCWFLVFMAATGVLAPRYGAVGVAVGMLGSYCLFSILVLIICASSFGLDSLELCRPLALVSPLLLGAWWLNPKIGEMSCLRLVWVGAIFFLATLTLESMVLLRSSERSRLRSWIEEFSRSMRRT